MRSSMTSRNRSTVLMARIRVMGGRTCIVGLDRKGINMSLIMAHMRGRGDFRLAVRNTPMSRSLVDPLPLKIYPYLLIPLIISLTIFILCLTSIHMHKNTTTMFCCPSPSKYKPRLSPSFSIVVSLLFFHVSCVASEGNEANSIRRTWIPIPSLVLEPFLPILFLLTFSVCH
ncbi:uncharacterized protein K441DRAFT_145482 [Cenococcum geophilum 1.58]|uniref:uncharacterized protein n=1 Tax=Cenococcum geophilum 1.58 TaxID=794803 RepID=UPI00358F2E78|nr:hypothetical protein K441DRAFT_145482 [Cenococcum geophilum 1.58]